jgi:hypothetical protein
MWQSVGTVEGFEIDAAASQNPSKLPSPPSPTLGNRMNQLWHPLGYALKAVDLGCHGRLVSANFFQSTLVHRKKDALLVFK